MLMTSKIRIKTLILLREKTYQRKLKWKSEFSSKAHCSCLAISKKLACRVRASRISFMSFLSVVSVAKLATVVCLFRGLGLKLTWLLFINKTPLSSESPSPSLLRLRFHQGHVFLQYYPYVHFIAECLRADILHVQSRAIFEPDAFCTAYAVRAGGPLPVSMPKKWS